MPVAIVTRNPVSSTYTVTYTMTGGTPVEEVLDIKHPFVGGTIVYRCTGCPPGVQHTVRVYASGFDFAVTEDDLFAETYPAVIGLGTQEKISPLFNTVQVADQIMHFPAGEYTFRVASSGGGDVGTTTLTVTFDHDM